MSNVRAQQRSGTKLVDITYDLSSPLGNPVAVSIAVSTNNGVTFNLPATSFSPANGSLVTPGKNRQVTWNAGADWNNRVSSQIKFRVTAGGVSADSAAVTVDTGNGNRPVVQDVRSAYCWGKGESGKHASFLNGVSLPLEFEVVPDWNGKTPGSIQFIGPWGTHTQSGTQTKRTYNVGTDFGVGGRLTVKLVAADGTESLPQPAYFDVIPPPPIVGSLLYLGTLNDLSGDLTYRTPGFDLDIFKGRSGAVGGALARLLPGETMEVSPMFRAEAQVDGSGVLTIDAVGGKKNEIKLNGTQKRRPDGKFGQAAAVDFGLGVQGELQLKYVPSAGQWVVDAGYLGVNAFGEFASAPIYVYAPPPVYFRYEITGELFVGVKVLSLSADGLNPEFRLSTEGFPEIKGIVGCGVGGLLAVEGYAGFAGKFEFTAPPVVCNKLGIGGKIGVQLVVIGFATAPIDIFSGTSWIVGGQPQSRLLEWSANEMKRLQTLLNQPDSSSFHLLPRDYLSASTPYGTFLSSKTVKPLAWGDPVSPGVPMVLQTNIFPYSEPVLAVAGTNRVLLFVTDNPNRSPENRTEVLWSRWNGSTWLNPTSVWNDGTADFSPAVGIFPDGSVLAVWANEKRELTNGAPLEVALAGLDIMAGFMSSLAFGNWTPFYLTSNELLERSPQLAVAANGRALLTWIRNATNSPLGGINAPNTLRARVWDGATWSSSTSITTNAGMILWSTVAYNGTNGVFLATLDPDDDQFTPEDQELWGATFDGTAWSGFARLTTNSVSDTKPQAAYDSGGRLLVAWHQGSNVVLRVGDLDLQNPAVVGAIGASSSAKDFILVTGPAGQISIVWEDLAADGSGPDPMLLNYDATLGVWSEPVRLLHNTNQLERSFSGAYADNGALLLAYNRVDVTPDTNGVPQFGAVDLMFLEYQIGSDLAVSSADISLSTNNPAPGQSVGVTAVVRNAGERAFTNVPVVFFDGNPASGGSLIGSTQMVAGVFPAGSTATVQVTWVVPQTTTNRTIYVVVDPAQTRPDRNRANNTATRSVLAADLQISDITVLHTSPTNRILNARCVNAGVIPSGTAVDAVFRRGSADGPVLATVPIANLPTNGVYDASFEWNLARLTFTNAFELVYVTVDAGKLVSEADEDNNTRIVSVMTSLDSDNDGLLDGEEARHGTDPLLADSDGDGLSDGAEVNLHRTNPLLKDTDGDGASDGAEVAAGTDPHSATSVFKVTSVVRNPDGSVTLQWSSVTNKFYTVLRGSTVFGIGIPVTNDMPGTPPVNTFTDTTATGARAFYRIIIW